MKRDDEEDGVLLKDEKKKKSKNTAKTRGSRRPERRGAGNMPVVEDEEAPSGSGIRGTARVEGRHTVPANHPEHPSVIYHLALLC